MADDYATIRVPQDAFEKAKQRKNDSNMTWAEYLTDANRGSPDATDVATEITARLNLDADDAKEEIQAMKEEVNTLKQEIDSLAFDGAVSDTEAERIMGRIDDLESTLPRKVAQEVRNG